MRKHGRNQRGHLLHRADRAYGAVLTATERADAMRSLGSVVYAARVDDVIKIGHTSDLPGRLHSIRARELLACVPGTLADEQAIHRRLVDHLHHGRERYWPTPAVVREVNELRARLGMNALAA